MSLNSTKIDYSAIIDRALRDLTERERLVLVKRYCLDGAAKKATLEQIGSDYNITRERVRQIENESLKNIKKVLAEDNNSMVSDLLSKIEELLEQHGGFIAHNHLLDHLSNSDEAAPAKALLFILETVLPEHYSVLSHPDFDIVFKNKNISDELVIELAGAINEIIEKQNEPVDFEGIVNSYKNHATFSKIDSMSAENHDVIEALLRARNDLKKNILNQWGKSEWTTITPKRMTDKAFLIMQREGKPLHFGEVARLINEANFDKKKACAATVHNELIMDKKYVLVGRGLYALKDWGFEAGTVSDIIARHLQSLGALDRDAITDHVLKQRVVKKTTIMLALMNKDVFSKNADGKYTLVKA